MFKIAVICGGPTRERGISLNSARSVMDHLSSAVVEIVPFYVDLNKNFYELKTSQLYSNTPSDFDFKLYQTAKALTLEELKARLKETHLVFGAIHGVYGDGGELAKILEEIGVPFVGSSSKACGAIFHKFNAIQRLKAAGFASVPSTLLQEGDSTAQEKLQVFLNGLGPSFSQNGVVVKPVQSGSSIGVFKAHSLKEAWAKVQYIWHEKIDHEVMIEEVCRGKEFTILVVQNPEGRATALVPTEIETSYAHGEIFDYRKKYLPTHHTRYHTPAHFGIDLIRLIREKAEQIFELFELSDFARFDGWLLDDGKVFFSDFNPISGMEQNSFLFRQAAVLGNSHQDILRLVVSSACRRWSLALPELPKESPAQGGRAWVPVLFGGNTAERQVSLMSGTNVWLKLRKSNAYDPEPYLLDKTGYIWQLPYSYTLNHTVEEIYENCIHAKGFTEQLAVIDQDIQKAYPQLVQLEKSRAIPTRWTQQEFLARVKSNGNFVFLALHGGDGENGTLQKVLEAEGIRFNGSGSAGSQICMDKFVTGERVVAIGDPLISSVPRRSVKLSDWYSCDGANFETYWEDLVRAFGSPRCVIKPRYDGCSAGIVVLGSAKDLQTYVELVKHGAPIIPPNTFANVTAPIEMATTGADYEYLLEAFVEVDGLFIQGLELKHVAKHGWFELTVGVLETQGDYRALSPSITVAEGAVLSLEEKFQGGTGVNITPPPASIFSKPMVDKIKKAVESVAKAVGIGNYARIDVFFNIKTQVTIVIEANSLPALTPSTVIYHQALAEVPQQFPTEFLEGLIKARRR